MHIESHHISKSFDGQLVLSDVSFAIQQGERVGIVGANGSGKSTLLKLLARIEAPDSGEIQMSRGATIGYVPQAPDYEPVRTVREVLEPLVPTGKEHALDRALDLFGLLAYKDTPFGSLSSGQKTRVYLARLIVGECDILLLDEPTNHLDVAALEWLEGYLQRFPGAVCVVSHDRVFLDRVAGRILECAETQVTAYGGNYSFYKTQKRMEQDAYLRAYEGQQKDIKRLKTTARDMKQEAERTDASRKPRNDNDKMAATFFANRSSNRRSAAAKSMEHRLTTMDELERPKPDPKLKVLLQPRTRGSQTVARAVSVSYATGDQQIFTDVSLTLEQGDRLALHGPNGVGKSTLVKLLLGELTPDAGDIQRGPSVRFGYLSQEHDSLQGTQTVLEQLIEKTGIESTLAHRLLAWLQVSRDKMEQSVNTLSKGEQSKVLLAEIIALGANCIILDEPTNHLDIPAREALEAALREYEGTLVVISHDRYFVEAVDITKHIYLENGGLVQR